MSFRAPVFRKVTRALMPVLAACGIGSACPSARASAPGPFDGDPRMSTPRTLSVHDRAIRDFLADMELQTGIRFFADPSVADDRVTLFAHERPLADSLRAVGALFDFTWTRSGAPPDYGYMLAQSASSAEREEGVRRARLASAAAAIVDESAAYSRLERLPEADVQKRAEETARELEGVTDPKRHRDLLLEHAASAQVLTRNEWRSLVNHLVAALSQEKVAALIQAGTTEYVWPDHLGFNQVPPDALPDTIASAGGAAGGQISFFRVRLTGAPGRSPRLQWHVVVGHQRAHAFDVTESGGVLPDVDPDSAAPAPVVESRPAGDLAAEVSVDVGPTPGESARSGHGSGRPSLGEALEAVDKAHPLDIVADAFYSTRVAGFHQVNRPLSEALDRLTQMTDHRWWREDGFVMVRSSDYEEDRAAEPPADALAQWTQAALENSLDLDDYAEMSALPDAKLASLLQMAVRGDFPAQLTPLNQVRDHLRLWNALTHAQRRKARSLGVAWSEMTEAQRKLLALATSDQRAGVGFRIMPGSAVSGLRLRLEAHETKLWGVRRAEGGSVSGVGSRDLAFQQFRRADKDLRLEDVKTVVFATDAFVYENERGMVVSRVWLTLPPRWEVPSTS